MKKFQPAPKAGTQFANRQFQPAPKLGHSTPSGPGAAPKALSQQPMGLENPPKAMVAWQRVQEARAMVQANAKNNADLTQAAIRPPTVAAARPVLPKVGALGQVNKPLPVMAPGVPVQPPADSIETMTLYLDELAMPKRPELPPAPTDREVFVDPLPGEDGSEELKEWLQTFGEVEEVHRLPGQDRGYLLFREPESAARCVSASAGSWSESERATTGQRISGQKKKTLCAYPDSLVYHLIGKEGAHLKEITAKAGVKHVHVFVGSAAPSKDAETSHVRFVARGTPDQLDMLRSELEERLEGVHEQLAKQVDDEAPKSIVVTGTPSSWHPDQQLRDFFAVHGEVSKVECQGAEGGSAIIEFVETGVAQRAAAKLDASDVDGDGKPLLRCSLKSTWSSPADDEGREGWDKSSGDWGGGGGKRRRRRRGWANDDVGDGGDKCAANDHGGSGNAGDNRGRGYDDRGTSNRAGNRRQSDNYSDRRSSREDGYRDVGRGHRDAESGYRGGDSGHRGSYDSHHGTEGGRPRADGGHRDADNQSRTALQWEKLYDEGTDAYYYWNHATGESSWMPPPDSAVPVSEVATSKSGASGYRRTFERSGRSRSFERGRRSRSPRRDSTAARGGGIRPTQAPSRMQAMAQSYLAGQDVRREGAREDSVDRVDAEFGERWGRVGLPLSRQGGGAGSPPPRRSGSPRRR